MNTETGATARTIRAAAAKKGIPPVEAMIDANRKRFQRSGEWATLLAVCPNSEAVLKAALVAARDHRAPMLFAATLNQVDLDAGYTGWRQHDFVDLVRSYSREIGFAGTAVCCLDHGGPWLLWGALIGSSTLISTMLVTLPSTVSQTA